MATGHAVRLVVFRFARLGVSFGGKKRLTSCKGERLSEISLSPFTRISESPVATR